MQIIENDFLRVSIHSAGAELRSVYDKKQQRELLWQRDPLFWPKSSPILFPFIGHLKGGTYTYNQEVFQMSKHGFARDHDFEVVQHTDTAISYLLRSNDSTLTIYPFSFELYLHYKMDGAQLVCTYEVRNLGAQEMLFSIGAHPAFGLDFTSDRSFSDYYLHFPEDQELTVYPVTEAGLLRDKPRMEPLPNGRLYLKSDMFVDDAWVLKGLQSTEVHLKSQQEDYGICVHFAGFPYLGLWAPVDAPFLCIEPWYGVNDFESHTGELEKKEGMVRLEASSSWTRSWEVEVKS